MCGLFGVASTWLSDAERDLFKQLGLVSGLRGLDGTGMMSAYRGDKKTKHKVFYHKEACTSGEYFAKHHGTLYDRPQPMFLAGHTRATTVGESNKENAHPFVAGHITGMHNGTIHGFAKLTEGKTDSAVLIDKISQVGVEEALRSVPIGGAYAVVFFDAKKGTLNFVRNDQRTLYCAWNKGRNMLIWSSEAEILDFIIARNTAKASQWEDVLHFATGNLYSIKIGENPIRMQVQKLDLEKKYDPPAAWKPNKHDWGGSSGNLIQLPIPRAQTGPLEFYPTLPQRAVSPSIMADLLGNGCSWCSSTANITQHAQIGWVSEVEYLCPDCLSDKTNMGWLFECFGSKIYINDPAFRKKFQDSFTDVQVN